MNTIKAISIGVLSSDELKKIEKIISDNRFNPSTNFGFDIKSSDSMHLACQFIERIINERTYETLEGVEEKIEYVDYYKINFIFRSNSSISLCLIDPPRNTKYGLQMIRSLLVSNAKLKAIEFDLAKMIALANDDEKIKITSASISNLKMDDEILAKVRLISNSDISHFVEERYKDNFGKIDSLSGIFNGVPIEISKLGRVKFSAENIDLAIGLLERLKITKD